MKTKQRENNFKGELRKVFDAAGADGIPWSPLTSRRLTSATDGAALFRGMKACGSKF